MHGPAPSPHGIRCYAFASFVLDIHKRQLWRDGHRVALTATTFDVLLFLIANRNGVVTKDEFFSHVWADTAVLEANLVRQISLLRRALDERLDEHEFIVTIPGRGYQFVAEVTELPALPDELAERSSTVPRSMDLVPPHTGAPRFRTDEETAGDSGAPVTVERVPPVAVEPKRSRPKWLLVSAAAIASIHVSTPGQLGLM